MRFHVPGLPHTVSDGRYVACAFTQKVRKLCSMLSGLGHEVIHYGCEGSDVDATRVDVVSRAELEARYPFDMDRMFAYDTGDDFHKEWYARVTEEIISRKGDRDFLLCSWGLGHKPLADALAAFGQGAPGGDGAPGANGRAGHDKAPVISVEPGIGYKGMFAPFKAFESYFWMGYLYGRNDVDHPPWFDCVIPNAFDPRDFEYRETKGDYLLYLGRLIEDKGVDIALQTADAAGERIVIAGQGDVDLYLPGRRAAHPRAEFAGFADREKRRELLAGAKALIAPTLYPEPFGGVAVEAMMSGTPVISSDWGGFSETVLHGVTGYRCRSFDQFVRAAESVGDLSRAACREHALSNYSTGRVALMYETWFTMLNDSRDRGWYQRHESVAYRGGDANAWLRMKGTA